MSAQPDNPEDLAKYIQDLLQNVKKQYEDMTGRVIQAIDDIATRVENLEKNVNSLLENVKTEWFNIFTVAKYNNYLTALIYQWVNIRLFIHSKWFYCFNWKM